jgi:hypothetical protein
MLGQKQFVRKWQKKTQLEIAYGRRPPDAAQTENMLPNQFTSEPFAVQKTDTLLRDLALKARLEARERVDIQRDLAQRLRPSDGRFDPSQSACRWGRDISKNAVGNGSIHRSFPQKSYLGPP